MMYARPPLTDWPRKSRPKTTRKTRGKAKVKKTVNDNNSELGVTWEHSYVNADRTRTFCVYSAPSEAAVREAAKKNSLPVDAVFEIPTTLYPK